MAEKEKEVKKTPTPTPPAEEKEQMMKVSDVKKLIAETIASMNQKESIVPKKATEHTAHLWRFDGKWVVDFVNRNTDPYVKKAIYTFQKFNAEKREFETWIELVFHDGSKKEVFLPNYLNSQNRLPIYCTIVKKEKLDKSYSVGEVEKKDWKNDRLVGTGVMVSQTVELYEEIITVRTPDGEEFAVPDYALC